MKVEQRKIDEVTPYGKNAKKHSDKQIKQIAASIQEFGFNQPIVVDKQGVVIVGHGRLAAARFLGLTTVPVLTVEITEEKAKAYRLADNKLNESEWDMKLVIEELKSISMPMLDLTGFNRKLVLDSDKWDDAVPKIPIKPRSKEGDLFELGEHRVLCGDSTRMDHAQKLMGKEKADMVFTDPPYNVNYVGKGENTQTGILNDKMDDVKFLHFLKDAFAVVRESALEQAVWRYGYG